jgi:predicted component of type VI protein secretion system
MTLSDRIVAGLKTMLLIQEQVARLESSQRNLADALRTKIEDHEKRLTRMETIIEIARPDGSVLRFAPQPVHQTEITDAGSKSDPHA